VLRLCKESAEELDVTSAHLPLRDIGTNLLIGIAKTIFYLEFEGLMLLYMFEMSLLLFLKSLRKMAPTYTHLAEKDKNGLCNILRLSSHGLKLKNIEMILTLRH